MVRIPKASESSSEGFVIPAAGTYKVRLLEVGETKVSEKYGNLQQLFKWELGALFDDEETEWVQEFPECGQVIHDYVNVESFFDGGGDPTRVSKLYKIVKALTPPDEFDPEDPGDTDDLEGRNCIIELEHGVKKMGQNAGQPKAVIAAYKYIKGKKVKAKPETEVPEYDDVDSIPF